MFENPLVIVASFLNSFKGKLWVFVKFFSCSTSPAFKTVVSSELNKSSLLHKTEQNCLCFRQYLPLLKAINISDLICEEPQGKVIFKG